MRDEAKGTSASMVELRLKILPASSSGMILDSFVLMEITPKPESEPGIVIIWVIICWAL